MASAARSGVRESEQLSNNLAPDIMGTVVRVSLAADNSWRRCVHPDLIEARTEAAAADLPASSSIKRTWQRMTLRSRRPRPDQVVFAAQKVTQTGAHKSGSWHRACGGRWRPPAVPWMSSPSVLPVLAVRSCHLPLLTWWLRRKSMLRTTVGCTRAGGLRGMYSDRAALAAWPAPAVCT